MDFSNFTTLVRDEVEKIAGNSYRVRLNDVRKNNGVVLCGLTVMRDGSNISPTIYLNNYYDEYVKGKATLVKVVNDVMDVYHKNKVNQSVDAGYFLDYGNVRQQVVYKLVNTEKNKELLEDVPHMEFMDLSIVFQCLVSQDGINGTAVILIHNAHQKMWDVSVEDLYHAAVENTQRILGDEIKPMADVLCDIMETEYPESFDCSEYMQGFSDCIPLYVLSNKSRMNGAACMLYPNTIRDFADAIGSNLYIIPSSVHELLLLPTEHDDESEEIRSMIREINDTQVSEEEILSYSVYFYDREEGKIVKL